MAGVIPEYEVTLEETIPASYVPWTPRPDEIDEEGFGYFRDTWALGRVHRSEAREIQAAESKLVSLVDVLADDAATYEELAAAVESADLDAVPEHVRRGQAWEQFQPYFGDSWLGGLELGVAGLVMALGTLGGCHSAASCRAHESTRSWSPYPVVLLAADEFRAQRLEEYVAMTGCGFSVDTGRTEFLVICASSVRSMMALAEEILANFKAFRRPRKTGRAGQSRNVSFEQGILDFDHRPGNLDHFP